MNIRDPLEDVLSRLDAPPPPADLAARCLATIPASAPEQRPFAWLMKGATMKRLAFAAVALAAVAFWTTRPTLQKNGITSRAPVSAFGQSIEAMRRVTFWRTAGRMTRLDGNDDEWHPINRVFDAQQGLLADFPIREGVIKESTLLRSNGELYERFADQSNGRDQVRVMHMNPKFWPQVRDRILPSAFFPTQDLGRFPVEPRFQGVGNWKGRPALVFTFNLLPSNEHKAQGRPSVRTDYYVDPKTKLFIAAREFSRWPDKPEQDERLTREDEWDYSERPDPSWFDPNRFCEGATEIEEDDGKPGTAVSPK